MPVHKLSCRWQPIGRIYEVWQEEYEVSRGVTEEGGGGEKDLLRRRLGETKPETCTQIAQANKQAQDAGHALRTGRPSVGAATAVRGGGSGERE